LVGATIINVLTVTNHIIKDALPSPPPKPVLSVKSCPPIIELYIENIDEGMSCSPTKHIQIYHSNDVQMTESFLIGEIDCLAKSSDASAVQSVTKQSILSFEYKNPQIGVPHYFRVAAVNTMGVGPCGEISDPGLIGTFIANFCVCLLQN
jgi:hypothetical protein